MPQIFDVTGNEIASYKHNELEFGMIIHHYRLNSFVYSMTPYDLDRNFWFYEGHSIIFVPSLLKQEVQH